MRGPIFFSLSFATIVCFGEELSLKAKPEVEALNLPVKLCFNPHLWSWALGNDRKNEIAQYK